MQLSLEVKCVYKYVYVYMDVYVYNISCFPKHEFNYNYTGCPERGELVIHFRIIYINTNKKSQIIYNGIPFHYPSIFHFVLLQNSIIILNSKNR